MTDRASAYHVKNIWKESDELDWYMINDMQKLGKPHEVGDSAIEHAKKKLSALGMRSGGKSKLQDLRECVTSLNIAINQIEQQIVDDHEITAKDEL